VRKKAAYWRKITSVNKMRKKKDTRYGKYFSNREIATIKKKERVIQALRETLGNIAAAAEKANVCRVSVFRWMREDEDFAMAVDEVRKASASVFESMLFKKISAGDTTCLLYYLNHQGRCLGYNASDQNDKPRIILAEWNMMDAIEELDKRTLGNE